MLLISARVTCQVHCNYARLYHIITTTRLIFDLHYTLQHAFLIEAEREFK